jgi:hypothetical protein
VDICRSSADYHSTHYFDCGLDVRKSGNEKSCGSDKERVTEQWNNSAKRKLQMYRVHVKWSYLNPSDSVLGTKTPFELHPL